METMTTSSVTETVTPEITQEASVVTENVVTETTQTAETVTTELVTETTTEKVTETTKESTKPAITATKSLLVSEQPVGLNKVALDTDVFQTMVAKAAKGSTMVDVIPLSCLMKITLKDGKFSLTTTDNINYLTISAAGPAGKELEVFVETKIFSQLISKLTSKTTILSVEDGKLVVEAGGKYNFATHTEQDGSMINLNVPQPQVTGTAYKITTKEISSILAVSKACKADMKEIPCLFNYYFDNEKVLTSNSFKACYNPVKVTSAAICLTPQVVNLLSVVQDDDGIEVSQDSEYVVITSTNGTLIGKKCPSIELEKFPAEALSSLFAQTVGDDCCINRTQMLSGIDRIFLFTEAYQSNKLTLVFGKEKISLKAPNTDSVEYVEYTQYPTKLEEPVVLDVDCKMLKEELTACEVEDLKFYFDVEAGIQIHYNNVKLLLSVLGEDEVA